VERYDGDLRSRKTGGEQGAAGVAVLALAAVEVAALELAVAVEEVEALELAAAAAAVVEEANEIEATEAEVLALKVVEAKSRAAGVARATLLEAPERANRRLCCLSRHTSVRQGPRR
jgi:hypothetical protein